MNSLRTKCSNLDSRFEHLGKFHNDFNGVFPEKKPKQDCHETSNFNDLTCSKASRGAIGTKGVFGIMLKLARGVATARLADALTKMEGKIPMPIPDPDRLKTLAAFDPVKLSVLLQNLPEGAIIYGLAPTGPAVAMPRAARREDEVIGAIVYDSCEILVWTGTRYSPLYRLATVDGRPTLVEATAAAVGGGVALD